MELGEIKSKEDLFNYLEVAIQLEHATIPPYMTALYSIIPECNQEAYNLIRVVLVEEMLHLTLSANILNAIGGKVNLTKKGFCPEYPTYLPSGETDFKVGLEKFSIDAVETFLDIERPSEPHKEEGELPGLIKNILNRHSKCVLPIYKDKDGEEKHFYSIGDFYSAIADGLEKVAEKIGEEELFNGDPTYQVTPEYYYSGGGDIIPIHNLEDAKNAIRLISEQGEGHNGTIYEREGELSHYYRFEQLKLGRYYHPGDKPGHPSGEKLDIDWNAVYPILSNAKSEDYPNNTSVYDANTDFNFTYKNFLKKLNTAFSGEPSYLLKAVGEMFEIKFKAYQLMRNPIPKNTHLNAAPTFELYTDEVLNFNLTTAEENGK
ncbi:ferritin-like domain-containing protein [Aureibacter tunicatorum]|uniref:Iminophenyl-pyruvate dimer synthase domain-containing protein n=1 Tax=Aureibacter tunicatorum TaxID=866807 RepID=A0AAE3XQ98_9BACT|nr:ferritin-like protein [Aureibacter tunicatorum]MDR6239389.1 hypothetical protein [Aureibacter tunicatorum]BDD04688.1 hypothetical protein AUTU_21710 [Aureibacter tunicatorum]